jgi:hypothetical protein
LGHASAGCRAQFQVEITQFTLENLRFGEGAGQQGTGQENAGFEHASLHEKRGAVTGNIRQMPDLDVCKHTGDGSQMKPVRRLV